MLICRSFVYVHQPKTGGTFVRRILERIHSQGPVGWLWKVARKLDIAEPQILLGFLWLKYPHNRKHAPACFIPPPHHEKPVLATIRNPFHRYVSQYKFGDLQQHPEEYGVPEKIRSRWPGFPDLTFEEFVRFLNEEIVLSTSRPGGEAEYAGFQTQDFVRTYCRNPFRVYKRLEDYDLFKEAVGEELSSVHFVSTSNLNRELFDFLLSMGYSDRRIGFIRDHPRVFPDAGGSCSDKDWRRYYSPELRDYVLERERLLFELFPSFAAEAN